jgi:AraC-like DNA-binding protein
VLLFKDLAIEADDFLILGPEVSAHITDLGFMSRRGLSVERLQTQFKYTKQDVLDYAKSIQLEGTYDELERRFLSETGLSPKQFAKIIQFQNSLTQLSVKDYTSLTDVVYQNGFSDQSHFIKVFKAFTGKTPKAFK